MTDLSTSHDDAAIESAETTGGGDSGGTPAEIRTRLVLDTSVLIADPELRPRVPRRRRGRPAHRRRRTRRPQEPLRRRRTRGTHGTAHARRAAGRPRRLARRAGPDRHRHRHAADRDQQHPQAPAHRARTRSGRSRQPDHRRRDRPVRLRSDHDGQQRRRTPDQGRPPRRRCRRTHADPVRPIPSRRSAGPRSTPRYEKIDCLYAAGAIALDAVTDAVGATQRERIRRPPLGVAVGARPHRRRRVRPARTPEPPSRGGCARGTRSSASRSNCCSIPTSP